MTERWEDRNRSESRDDRGYRDRERGERGTAERAGDEVRSWFGDDEAARRRRMDEMRDDRAEREWRPRPGAAAGRGWERTREAVRDVTDRDRDGRTGLAEWRDDDRPSDYGREPRYTSGRSCSSASDRAMRDRDDYWTRERSFGDTSRYATADPYTVPSWNVPPGAYRNWQGPNYAGRGPRGYTRSDERIREDVCDRLTEDPRVDASDVEVQVKNGEVTLAGSVSTREQKRFAEDLVEVVTGVREVNNSLKVRPADEVIGSARSGSSTLGLTETRPPTPTRTK